MVLVVGLIMLIMISLAAIASYNLGKTSLEVVGNMQFRNEAIASANSTIQEVLSTTKLFSSPDNVLDNPCNGPNTRCFDLNDDGADDLTVTVDSPRCIQVRPKLNAQLDLTDPNEAACATGAAQVFGIEGVATGNSLCSDSIWEIVATAEDTLTNATLTLTQGVGVLVTTVTAETECPLTP